MAAVRSEVLRRAAILQAFAIAASLLAVTAVLVPWALGGKREAHAAGKVAARRVRAEPPATRLADPPLVARTPEEVRAVVGYCNGAGPDDVTDLRRLAAGPDPLVAGNAVRALGRLGACPSGEELERLLADPRPRVRQEAIIALGWAGTDEAVERLERILDEDEASAAPLAIQALGRLGGEKARAVLSRRLARSTTDDVERAFLREALIQAQ
jgi:HEAT repeat protein